MKRFSSISCIGMVIALLSPSVYGQVRRDRAPAAPPTKVSTAAKGGFFRIEMKLVEVQEEGDGKDLAIKVHAVQSRLDRVVKELRNGKKSKWDESVRVWMLDRNWHSFSSLSCTKCHAAGKNQDKATFFSNLYSKNPHGVKTWMHDTKGVKVLASPYLIVTPGRTAEMHINSTRKLQYFKQLKKGVYALEEDDVKTGLTIKAAVQDLGDEKIRLKPLSVSVTAVKGREPLEGVKLDIGKPILSTTSIDTSVIAKFGKASVISIDSPRGGRILISVKVLRSGPPAPVDPNRTRATPAKR